MILSILQVYIEIIFKNVKSNIKKVVRIIYLYNTSLFYKTFYIISLGNDVTKS